MPVGSGLAPRAACMPRKPAAFPFLPCCPTLPQPPPPPGAKAFAFVVMTQDVAASDLPIAPLSAAARVPAAPRARPPPGAAAPPATVSLLCSPTLICSTTAAAAETCTWYAGQASERACRGKGLGRAEAAGRPGASRRRVGCPRGPRTAGRAPPPPPRSGPTPTPAVDAHELELKSLRRCRQKPGRGCPRRRWPWALAGPGRS